MGFSLLPNCRFSGAGPLSRAFRIHGLSDFHAAAWHVWHLPYGRTSRSSDYHRVLPEGRGTCSTKHALLAALAQEHALAVSLGLGVYEMHEGNTPGVGRTLEAHGLSSVPEAHCYLLHEGTRIDLTRADQTNTSPLAFLHEETISPGQIGPYKAQVHQQFLRTWSQERDLDFAAVWKAREACIEALSPEAADQRLRRAIQPYGARGVLPGGLPHDVL